MAIDQKKIYVYENFSDIEPQLLGTLFVDHIRGRESYSFEYETNWIKSSKYATSLDPDLQMFVAVSIPWETKIYLAFSRTLPQIVGGECL